MIMICMHALWCPTTFKYGCLVPFLATFSCDLNVCYLCCRMVLEWHTVRLLFFFNSYLKKKNQHLFLVVSHRKRQRIQTEIFCRLSTWMKVLLWKIQWHAHSFDYQFWVNKYTQKSPDRPTPQTINTIVIDFFCLIF